MIDSKMRTAVADAIEWALLQGLSFKVTQDTAAHTAFSFTPSSIDKGRFEQLKSSTPLLGRLIHAVSEDHIFLEEAISPVASGDAFFDALLKMHTQLYGKGSKPKRLPLLIMRSDFMDDAESGPKLIEINGIAAGMGPFGQMISQLHGYLKNLWPKAYSSWSATENGEPIDNPAIARLAKGIAQATMHIKREFNDEGPASFLMIVQANEDNVFDQHLLEQALQSLGIRTVRRTFRELHGQLSSAPGERLFLDGIGPIDTVYLRAGYEY